MLHRLMEVAVVEYDASRRVGLGKGEVVVEDELQRGIANQIALHLDAAVDGAVDDVARAVEQNVDLFIYVDENVVVVAFVVD